MLFRAQIIRVPIGLAVLAVAACGVVPAAAPARAAHPPDPPSFLTIVAALTSDQGDASADLGNETIAIKKGYADPAAQRCYVLANDVRYDVEKKLDGGARASTSNDAASFQAQLDAKWQDLVNLQQYNQDFSNNDVAPYGGAWATAAISAMSTTMTYDAGKANAKIAAVNKEVADGYQRYREAWSQWDCPVSKLLQEPRQIPLVKVKNLPSPADP